MRLEGADGRIADVDKENRLTTAAVSQVEDNHLNTEGKVWSISFAETPADANDYFFYLKNNGTLDLKITDIRISSSVPTTIFYEHVTGTPVFVTGTDPLITNRQLGNAKAPNITAQYDTDITGLTSQGVLFFEECDIADRLEHLKSTSNIIIPQGQAVAFRREAATGILEVLVSLIETEEK